MIEGSSEEMDRSGLLSRTEKNRGKASAAKEARGRRGKKRRYRGPVGQAHEKGQTMTRARSKRNERSGRWTRAADHAGKTGGRQRAPEGAHRKRRRGGEPRDRRRTKRGSPSGRRPADGRRNSLKTNGKSKDRGDPGGGRTGRLRQTGLWSEAARDVVPTLTAAAVLAAQFQTVAHFDIPFWLSGGEVVEVFAALGDHFQQSAT